MSKSSCPEWLIGRELKQFDGSEENWTVGFDNDTTLRVGCLWRLIEDGRVRFTSRDDGCWFGLPAPVEAAAEVAGRLVDQRVVAIELKEGTLDLEIRFSSGHALQFIANFSGYEAWQLSDGSNLFVAVGGGELAVFNEQ